MPKPCLLCCKDGDDSTGAASGSFLRQHLPEKVRGSTPHGIETEGNPLPSSTTAGLEMSHSFAGPRRCDLSEEPPILNPFVRCATPWIFERGGCRSTKRPFSCIDTDRQCLYSSCLCPTALFWSGSTVSILLCAYSFILRPSFCWGGVSGCLQIDLSLKQGPAVRTR